MAIPRNAVNLNYTYYTRHISTTAYLHTHFGFGVTLYSYSEKRQAAHLEKKNHFPGHFLGTPLLTARSHVKNEAFRGMNFILVSCKHFYYFNHDVFWFKQMFISSEGWICRLSEGWRSVTVCMTYNTRYFFGHFVQFKVVSYTNRTWRMGFKSGMMGYFVLAYLIQFRHYQTLIIS